MTDHGWLESPRRLGVSLAACALLSACAAAESPGKGTAAPDPHTAMSRIAESYVRLVLAVGEHAPDYVDAYYGPKEWRDEVAGQVKAGTLSPSAIRDQAAGLIKELEGLSLPTPGGDVEEMTRLRHAYLLGQTRSLHAYAGMLLGDKHTFDAESRLLYDAEAPHNDEEHFRAILSQLEAKLPGEGPIAQRYERFHADFTIPRDRLDAVFQAAIAEARRRVAERMQLPPNESFELSYVTGKPWSGYNWYKGNGHSLIEINVELPIFIDRAIDLACHEGYPGHHVYNALLEASLVRQRGWMEFSVYPLFSPQSLIAEGSANFGIDVAFTRPERIAFEKEVLVPLAGLDPARADAYYEVHDLVAQLAYAGNEAARRYLDGAIDATAAAAWLTEFTLASPERARQRIGFMDKYRSYVINYNLGKDLVRAWIEGRGGTPDNPDARWREFEKLLSSPRLPSGLH
jgi:hypothetical protein